MMMRMKKELYLSGEKDPFFKIATLLVNLSFSNSIWQIEQSIYTANLSLTILSAVEICDFDLREALKTVFR